MADARKCTCKFVKARWPMDNRGCVLHTEARYGCDTCDCNDYAPIAAPIPHRDFVDGFYWALCVCGHSAQNHNNTPAKEKEDAHNTK